MMHTFFAFDDGRAYCFIYSLKFGPQRGSSGCNSQGTEKDVDDISSVTLRIVGSGTPSRAATQYLGWPRTSKRETSHTKTMPSG